METRAFRFHGVGDLRDETIELESLGAGDVLVSVQACGVCGSDYHFLDGSARTGQLPVTLGHEISGVVIESRDSSWDEGDQIVVAAGVTCGECRQCLADREDLCERLRMTGIDFDGGLASYLVVPGTALLSRPDKLDPKIAATAVDAGATAYHASVCKAGVRDGDSVLVVGAGGLGSFAIQIAKERGAAPVIAADRDEAALDRAEKLGADEVVLVDAGASLGRTVKLITGGGVDVALEFVGRAATVDAAIKSLRPGSAAIVAGIGREPLVTLPPVLWATNEYALVGSFGSHRRDAEAVLKMLADGTLDSPPIERVGVDAAVDRIVAAASGHTLPQGRLIVEFDSGI